MQEFVIRNIWDHDLILVAKDYTTASFSFLKYLSEREYQICVLLRPGSSKYHFIDHYIVIGEQTRFSAWLKEARDKAIRFYTPTVETVSSLEEEVVRSWAEETGLKQVWVYFISHEHDDEFTRNVPTLRSYALFPRSFTTVLPEEEVEPALKAFEQAAYLSASISREEPG